MSIPGLRDALVTILEDFSLQSELRRGCKTILEKDCQELLDAQVRKQKQGMRIDPANTRCPLSNELIAAATGSDQVGHVLSCEPGLF
jgi:hypothetical protein